MAREFIDYVYSSSGKKFAVYWNSANGEVYVKGQSVSFGGSEKRCGQKADSPSEATSIARSFVASD